MNERLAGILRREKGEISSKHFYLFEYNPDYFADPGAPAISLTLPKSRQTYLSLVLFPFFSGLLTEGTNHSIQVRALQLDERDEFSLLLATAQRQTIGAITVREIL
ncbi:MAG: phosphatidylinositol kinase [Hymenobacter sp.]|nr:MAG: phosphatidylinositol kinase [Hymenobacter sp.]